jgi:hypothetical protein
VSGAWAALAHDDDHHVSAVPQVILPLREEARRRHADAMSDDIGIGERLPNLLSVVRQEVRFEIVPDGCPSSGAC